MNKLLTLGLSLENVIHDYKIVADSVVDDKTYQNADVGILLSNLDDVVKWLEELRELQEKNKILDPDIEISHFEMVDYKELYLSEVEKNKELKEQIKELQSKSEEVCEWRIVDRPNGFPIFNTSCGAIRLQCAKGIDIYCNACGRKIKVVSE